MVAPNEGRPSVNDRHSIRVINAIAENEGTTPTEIRPVLYDIVDLDALDSLFSSTHGGDARADGHVEFRYGPQRRTCRNRARLGFPVALFDLRNGLWRQLSDECRGSDLNSHRYAHDHGRLTTVTYRSRR